MVRTFKGEQLEALAKGRVLRGLPPDIAQRARRKLFMLVNAAALDDCDHRPATGSKPWRATVPDYSIRINDQWRLCFRWTQEGAADIEITDYH